MPQVRRSVQYHALADDPVRSALAQAKTSTAEVYDGVGIEWFDDIDGRSGLAGDAFRHQQAREDWFIDHSRSTVQLGRPEVVFETPGRGPGAVRVPQVTSRPELRRLHPYLARTRRARGEHA